MILRPIEPRRPASPEFVSAWEAVERTQREECESWWLITQPSHAALAAEVASSLRAPAFPVPDAQMVRAIALHDAGWGIADAQAIMKSRSLQLSLPQSFAAIAIPQFLEAWEKSIETCQSSSPAGGYIVSRHFCRLAAHRLNSALKESSQDAQKLEAFLKAEERRQKRLAGKQSLGVRQLEDFTDLLQFCDLFSLYVCSGAAESVTFPQLFGLALRVSNQPDGYALDPPVIPHGAEFAVAALRHPATREVSSREIAIRIQ
jgi:hypothetical protein